MVVPVSPQAQLLSAAHLRLNNRLVRAQPEPEVVILRACGGGRRLVVTPAQADLLSEGFATPKTVPEVLVRTIAESRCPPLREFYELVLQAHAADILLADSAHGPEVPPIRWRLQIPLSPVSIVAGGAAIASVVLLAGALPHWRGPGAWTDVVGGWMAACALLSAGQALAACVIAGCGEVQAVRVFWRTRFPHFRVDVAEAVMGGRTCEAAVAIARAAPILVGAAVAAWQVPGWLAALCGGALMALSPFGDSAARQWLASRRRAPRYSIRADFLFEPVRADLWVRWTARWRGFLLEFGWLGLVWTIVWCAWLLAAFVHCMPATAAGTQAWLLGVPRPMQLGAEYLLLGAIVLGLLVSVWARFSHWLRQRAWSAPLRGADAREPERPALTGDRAEMLAQVPLFQELDRPSRAALAEAMEAVGCGRGDEVVREDEPGEDFFLIVAGEMEVRKRLPQKRRAATIGWLGPGDCFGEIALLENTVRTTTVVACRPTLLLKLGRAPFEQFVVARLGATRIRELLQHARFLGRLTFTAGWPFAVLVKFAQRCRTVRVDADRVVVTQGEPNHWFYLIYDGALEAREGARVLRRMGPGDYFGEISLLEGWPATATLVTIEESRCLVLGRAEFLELFARDFQLGLRMEAIARQRLGSGLFASR